MPGKLLGLDFGRNSSALDVTSRQPSTKQPHSSQRPLEARRGSMEKMLKRPFMGKKHSSDSKARSKERSLSKDKYANSAPKSHAKPDAVKLTLIMESPPVTMLDQPSQSSGAIISGKVQITPNRERVDLESCKLFLERTISTKRPPFDKCRDCLTQVEDIFEWDFFTKPRTLRASDDLQEIPFSYLIPGHVAATTHGQIASIEYSLHVRAKTTESEVTELRREVDIKRALRTGSDKSSVRVFPPTNLTLTVTMPNGVHPIGEFPVLCKMTGITQLREDTQTRWRLKKLTWRIEEHEIYVAPACRQHTIKLGGDGKGVKSENTREVGAGELRQGWKTDLSEGEIEGEFMAHIEPNKKPQCGVQLNEQMKISHNLVLELVIAEEWAPNKKPEQATPTGSARVLRTQITMNVTERAGMGLAWDDEQPPVYEDVPASPPHYHNTTVENYEGDDLNADVDRLNLNDGNSRPQSPHADISADIPQSLPPSYHTAGGGFSDPNFALPGSSRDSTPRVTAAASRADREEDDDPLLRALERSRVEQ